MAPTDIAIRVAELSKMYKVYRRPADMLKELLVRRPCHQEAWVLNDISFDVGRGHITGVVGRNGAGKSTLLRILAGTLDKTSGSFEIDGRISAILELGTGFHPEYSGRDNVFMGGMCLGLGPEEIESKYNDIVGFAELQEYMDRPFKTYSSGMKARLTFSVAAAIDPEVLIVDEALAAGDVHFVAKCVRRIEEICRSGATVLFVSHNLAMVERFCTDAIYLDKGELVMRGGAREVCRQYEHDCLAEGQKALSARACNRDGVGTGAAQIRSLEISGANGQPTSQVQVGERCSFRLVIESEVEVVDAMVGIQFSALDGRVVAASASNSFLGPNYEPASCSIRLSKGTQTVELEFEHLLLGAGTYFASAGVAPNANVNTYAEFLHYIPRGWSFVVERNGVQQTVDIEIPARWTAADHE